MVTMMRSSSGASATPLRWPDSQQQQQQPPPPPANVGSSSTSRMGSYEKASRDKNRDQDLERELKESARDWDRNYASGSSGRGGGRYHDPDERYSSRHCREGVSEGYGRSTEWRR